MSFNGSIGGGGGRETMLISDQINNLASDFGTDETRLARPETSRPFCSISPARVPMVK